MLRESLEKLDQELGESLPLPKTRPLRAQRSFEPGMTIDFSEEEGVGIVLRGEIAPLPSSPAFQTKAMLANLFGVGTRGGVIGAEERGKGKNMLTLSLVVDYNCPYKEFREAVEDFMSVASFWRDAATAEG